MAKVTREANGTWCSRIYFGLDPVTGKQLRKYKAFPEARSEAEAQVLADEWERGFRANGELHIGDTMDSAFTEYLIFLRGKNKAARTIKTYRADYQRYVSPRFGRKAPREVMSYQIDGLYTWLVVYGGKRGQGLSPTTVNKLHGMLKGFFKWACKYRLCPENPMFSVEPPEKDEYNAVFFTEEQFGLISHRLNAIRRTSASVFERNAAMAARMAQMTGVRIGEACAVARGDLLLKSLLMIVRANVVEVDGQVTRVPKTKGKKSRPISLDDEFLEELLEHIAWQDSILPPEALRDPMRLTICANEYGRLLSPSSVSRWFSALRDKMHLPKEASFHSLRHTHASILLANGMDLKTIAERLGHANESLTLKIYSHLMPGRDQAAAQTIAAIDRRMSEKPEADP